MNEQLEETYCPLCNCPRNSLVEAFNPYEIVQCTQCDLVYLSPRLKEKEAIRLYQEADYFHENQGSGYLSYSEQEPQLRATFKRFLKALKKRGLAGGRFLEIGCGYGYLLDEANDYFDYRVGTDFSSDAVKYAQNYADKIYLGGLEEIEEKYAFDCIIATNVLEHTYNPIQFLNDLTLLLKPSGYIVMAVPNFSSFIRPILGKNWPSYKVPEHTIYFDQHTLHDTFNQAGLTRISEFPFPHAFSLKLILGKFNIGLPSKLQHISIWVPTTMTACIGFKDNSDG